MMRLSTAYSEADSLPILAGPRLAAAREAFDESASLAVLDGEEIIFVARSESSHTASTGMRVGSRMPALLAAAGRVLIAAQPADEIAAHLDRFRPVRMHDGAVFTVAAARRRIEETADLGYSSTDEELEAGVRAIAVPVVNARGVTLAAMSISALSARFTMAQMREQFLPVLVEEARKLGSML
jgi:IclR family pca regulon transcriptional regulator